MIFHRLRVLSFSKSLLSIKSVNNTKSDVKEPIKCKGAPEVGLAMPLHVFQVTNTKVSKKNTKSSGLDRMPVRPRFEFKSKSETFRNSSRKHRKRRKRKALSLNDIKRRLSLKDLNLNCIRQKFQSFKKENICNHNKKVAKKHELKVLYIAELGHRNRKRKTHRRKPKTPQSSCNLFGFYSHNRIFDPHTFYYKYHKGCTPFNKLRARSALKRLKLREAHNNCPYTHHPLKVVTTSSINYQLVTTSSDSHATCCTNPLHYNLLKFPKGSKIKLSRNNKFLRRQCRRKSWADKKIGCYYSVSDKFKKESSLIKVPVVCVDMAVSTCGSRKRNTPKTGISHTRSSNKCPSKELRDSTLKTPCNRRRPSKHSLLTLSSLYHEMYSKLLKCSTHRTKRYSTRQVFKYIFLFLLVIVWSPCIMGIAIGWLLSSPLRPQHVMNDEKEKTRESIYDCFCSECGFDWWSKYIVNVKRISIASKRVFFHIFRREKYPKCEPKDLPRCRSHPDPTLKYSLYHADGRGWVIKPDSPGARVPSQQNRFKRTFQNMFCNYDCSSQSSCKNTNINGGGASNKSVCHEKMSANASFRSSGNPILSKCGYSNKHVEDHIEPKAHNSGDDFKPLPQSAKLQLVQSSLKSLIQQKSQATSKYKLNQSNEAVPSTEAVCKKTVQQQLADAERHSDIDHPSKEPDKNDCFQKPTKSSEMSNCSHLGTSCKSVIDKLINNISYPRDIALSGLEVASKNQKPTKSSEMSNCCDLGPSNKSVIDKLINNISSHKDIAISGVEVASKSRVCGISECKMPEKTTTSPVGGKSVKGVKEEKRSEVAQETSSKCKVQPPEDISHVKMKPCLKSDTQPGPELVQPLPVRRRSVLKSSCVCSSPKPDRVTIAEGDPSSKSAKPQKILNINTETKQRGLEKPKLPIPKPQPKSKKQGQSVGDTLDKKVPKKERILSAKVGTLFHSLGRRTADSIGSSTKPHRITEAKTKTKEKEKIHLNIINTKNHQQAEQRGLALPKRKIKDKTLPSKKQVGGYSNRKVPENKNLPVKRKFSQNKKPPFWHKVRNWFRRSANSFNKFDRDFHNALYPADLGCADQYLVTLRSRPWFWVYHCCPKQYPSFLRTYYCTKNCCFYFLASVSFCFWAPTLMCCYLCYQLCLAMCC